MKRKSETEYLLSTKANEERLMKSIAEVKQGKIIVVKRLLSPGPTKKRKTKL